MDQAVIRASCRCGRVSCEAVGKPIVSAVCYCEDCQEGGRRIEGLHDAPPVLDPDGGTPYLSYRDDRFSCISGADLLVGYKIKDDAPTQRFVASCCNSAMFLKFGPGHWISAYRRRFLGEPPPIEMRNKTKHRSAQSAISEDVPSYPDYPPKLIFRLFLSRLAMLLGR